MKKTLQFAALFTAVGLALTGCGRPAENSTDGKSKGITVQGSNTMVNLGQAWAEAFGAVSGNPSVSIQGNGSGTGITALLDGSTDIAQSSREMKTAEIESAKAKGFTPKEIIVAQDGLTVIVNKSNPVSKLTVEQLGGIFSGKISNWKDVGGNPGAITLVSRDKSSGTYDFFLNHVLRNGDEKNTEIQYSASARMEQSSQAIVQEVSSNEGAIGYVGFGYAQSEGIKDISVAKTAAGPFIVPSIESIKNKTYPISRPLYFYTRNEPTGDIKNFVDFVLSPEGQALVGKLEFVPVQ